MAINKALLGQFDKLVEKRGYTNRSEAFRDLIRNELVKARWESPDSEVFGTIPLAYDHHVRLLTEKLLDLQHRHHSSIISSTHVHLEHDNRLEVIVIRAGLTRWRNSQMPEVTKGVKHGRFTFTASGRDLP